MNLKILTLREDVYRRCTPIHPLPKDIKGGLEIDDKMKLNKIGSGNKLEFL